MNAAISARAKMRAGPRGCRELRTAIFPPSSRPSSTQSPWGLLCLLFRQAATGSDQAGLPLVVCDICDLSIKPSPGDHGAAKSPKTAKSRYRNNQSRLVVLACVRDVEMEIAGPRHLLHAHTRAGTVVGNDLSSNTVRRRVTYGRATRKTAKVPHGQSGRDRTAECARRYADKSREGDWSVRPWPLSARRSMNEPGLPPELERLLLDVVADGFVLYCCGPIAAPHALVASYQWKDCVDLVTIRCFEQVTTARVPVPRHGPVDVFAPDAVVWAYEGPPRWALRALLDLVPPQHPGAPCIAYPAPPSSQIPRAEQRPMTIRFPPPGQARMRAVRLAGRDGSGSIQHATYAGGKRVR
jgi:hypothetical protein